MAYKNLCKFVVFVPLSHVEAVRSAICKAGAGKIGNYDNCTFISKGIGTFRPLKGSKPYIGKAGRIEKVKEAKIEAVVRRKDLKKVIATTKKAHPYEEPAFDAFELL